MQKSKMPLHSKRDRWNKIKLKKALEEILKHLNNRSKMVRKLTLKAMGRAYLITKTLKIQPMIQMKAMTSSIRYTEEDIFTRSSGIELSTQIDKFGPSMDK